MLSVIVCAIVVFEMVNVNGNVPSVNQSYKLTAEIGRVGNRRFGGYMQEEFDPNLRGQRGMRRFDEMRRNDPDIGAILIAIEMSIQSVPWNTEEGGDSSADQDAAEFLWQCWHDMSMSPADFMSDICTMFPFGFHLAEIVYKRRLGPKPKGADVPSSKYNDGKIGWRKFAPRHQETIERWVYDDKGGLQGAMQELPQGGTVFLPIDKCILFTTRRERGNPEGYSILRNAWSPYYIKTNMEEIEVISAERDMTGIPYIRLPAGATEDDKEKALEILERIKWDDQAGIVLPTFGEQDHQKWEFGVVGSPGAPRIDPNVVIRRCAVSIARSVLAQFLTLGQEGVGSYALSRDHKDLFHLAIKGWLDRIEDTINRFAVERLMALNAFTSLTDTPKLRHGRVGQRQIDVFVAALEKLATLGMPMSKEDWNFIREELELPLLSDEKLDEWEEEEESKGDLLDNLARQQPSGNDDDNDIAPTQQTPDTQTSRERWFSNDAL